MFSLFGQGQTKLNPEFSQVYWPILQVPILLTAVSRQYKTTG